MKKILSIALIATLLMTMLVGCGKSKTTDTTETTETTEITKPITETTGTLEISGDIGTATEIKLANVSDSAVEKQTMTEFLSGKATSFACYDIKLSDKEGKTVQPDGTVEVRVKLTDELAKATGDAYVVFYSEDGKFSRINCTEKDGYVTFKTNHFSIYTICKYDSSVVTDNFESVPEDPQIKDTAKEHEHKYTEVVTKEATCTAKGLKTYTCECGDTYAEEIAKTDHSWGDFVYNKDASYDADGTETRVCSVCGEAETRTKEGTKLVKKEESTKAPETTKEPAKKPEQSSTGGGGLISDAYYLTEDGNILKGWTKGADGVYTSPDTYDFFPAEWDGRPISEYYAANPGSSIAVGGDPMGNMLNFPDNLIIGKTYGFTSTGTNGTPVNFYITIN